MVSFVLPGSNSPTIALGTATEKERLSNLAISMSEWTGPLSDEVYMDRVKYISSLKTVGNEGFRPWILYDTAETLSEDGQLTVLANCETYRRNAIISYCVNGSWKLEKVFCYGIGSVFCRKEFRMRGYARRMVKELNRILSGENHVLGSDKCTFSFLFSDVGTVILSSPFETRPNKSIRNSTLTRISTAFLPVSFQFGIDLQKRLMLHGQERHHYGLINSLKK
jgi:hypothetical protein